MITKARFCEGETFADFLLRPIKNHDLWVAITNHVVIPVELSARVNALGGHWHLLVVSEDWCGDSVNIVPILAKLTQSVTNMDMRILARDENLDIMDTHLTGGKSRSIPSAGFASSTSRSSCRRICFGDWDGALSAKMEPMRSGIGETTAHSRVS